MSYKRIKKHYAVVVHAPDTVEIRTGVWNPTSFTLHDDEAAGKLASIITRLDGSQSAKDLAKACGVSRSQVEGVIDHLNSLGLVEDEAGNAFDAYCDLVGGTLVGPAAARSGVRTGVVLFAGFAGGELAKGLEETLRQHGELLPVQVVEPHEHLWRVALAGERDVNPAELAASLRGKLCVLAGDHVDPLAMAAFNAFALRYDLTWLHVVADGPFLFIGPTLGQSAGGPCYQCLESRITMNLREGGIYQSYKEALARGGVQHAQYDALVGGTIRRLAVAHASMEVLHFAMTGQNFTAGKVLAIYLPTMEFTFHEVLKFAACQACGSLQPRDDHQLYFDFQTLMAGAPV